VVDRADKVLRLNKDLRTVLQVWPPPPLLAAGAWRLAGSWCSEAARPSSVCRRAGPCAACSVGQLA
jgi:hypothetical protein